MSPKMLRRLAVTLVAIWGGIASQSLTLSSVYAWFSPGLQGPHVDVPLLDLASRAYWGAAGLMIFLSVGFRPIRRMLDESRSESDRFDRWIVGLAVLLAISVGWAQGMRLKLFLASTGTPPLDYFPLLTGGTVMGATMILVLLGRLVTQYGLGNGLVWLTVLPLVAGSVMPTIERLRAGIISLTSLVVLGLLLFALCHFYLQKRTVLRLVRLNDEDPTRPSTGPALSLRLNTSGAIPFNVASALSASFMSASMILTSPNGKLLPYWAFDVITVVLAILLHLLITSWAYEPRGVESLINRYGYRFATIASGTAAQVLTGMQSKQLLLSIPILLILTILAITPMARDGYTFPISGPFMLTVGAVIVDAIKQFRIGLSESALEPPSQVTTGKVLDESGARSPAAHEVVLECDLILETELAVATLREHGIAAVADSNRALPISGSLALWDWAPPSSQLFLPHRRLGGGRAVVKVSAAAASRAREILGRVSTPGAASTTKASH